MRLPSSVCECAVAASVSAREFFARPDRIKKPWHYPTRYGYVSTRDKQAFRLLTADMLEGVPLPDGGADGHGLGQRLTALSSSMDEFIAILGDFSAHADGERRGLGRVGG